MLFTLALLLQVADSTPAARNPAYSPDGRLAVSVQGDLWVVSKNGEWSHVTAGPAWDREPAWTPDGKSLVFSSDRSGNFDLWSVSVDSPNGAPTRITSSPLPEGEPAVGRDGRIYFVRGRLGAATLWTHDTNGNEARVTKDRAVERWPVVSAAGDKLAYVTIGDGLRKLHVRTLASGKDTVALTDARIERPAWSPAGDRLSWTASGARGAVYVTSLDGKYVNELSARHAESAWNPDGKTIALAEIPVTDAIPALSYNGDPDRTGDREQDVGAEAEGAHG